MSFQTPSDDCKKHAFSQWKFHKQTDVWFSLWGNPLQIYLRSSASFST